MQPYSLLYLLSSWLTLAVCAVIPEPLRISHPIQADYQDISPNNSTQYLTRKLPSAIIIGVKKSGTRALLEFLRTNPLVSAPGPEVHFFDRHFHRGVDWYRNQMPLTSAEQITIEKSPSYFVTKLAPERIYKTLDKRTKLILVVRNPVTRAISDYTQTASKRPDMPVFEDIALLSNGSSSPSTATVNRHWGPIRIGFYHRFIKRWLKYFPLNQIHIVDGENLIKQPAEEVRQVEQFLQLPGHVNDSDFVTDPVKGFPCIRKGPKRTVHCLGNTKGRKHPVIAQNYLNTLRTFYAPENEEFFQLIGRRFHWK